MKTRTILGGLLLSLAAACGAHTAPQELVDARAAYARAQGSPNAQLVPAEVHVAKVALDKAEARFAEDDDSIEVRDLAYIALRQSQRALALGKVAQARGEQRNALAARDQAQAEIIADQRQKLDAAESTLQAQQNTIHQRDTALVQQQQATEAERAARLDAEKKAQDAMDALAKSLAVKNDDRGTVITLSGSVLFATNKAVLLPGAQAQLDQVAEALKTQAESHFTIEGHTDNQGTDAVNNDLSRRRASAVRDYLVVRGVSPNAISIEGRGSSRPVADNKSTEGRAMNRRVEIVVEGAAKSASR